MDDGVIHTDLESDQQFGPGHTALLRHARRWSSLFAAGEQCYGRTPVSDVDGAELDISRFAALVNSNNQRLKRRVATEYIRAGVHGRRLTFRTTWRALAAHNVFVHKRWRHWYALATLLHMGAPVLLYRARAAGDATGASLAVLAEFAAISTYVVDLMLFVTSFGTKPLRMWTWVAGRAWVVAAMAVSFLVAIFQGVPTVRLLSLLIPIPAVLRLRHLRKMATGALGALPEVGALLTVAGFLLCILGLIAWTATASPLVDALPASSPYTSLPSSILRVTLLSQSPSLAFQDLNVLMGRTRAMGLLFVSVAVAFNLFIFRLLIAAAFRAFQAFARREYSKSLARNRHAVRRAFALTASPLQHTVDEDEYCALMRTMRPTLPLSLLRHVFRTFVPGESGGADLPRFAALCSVASLKVRRRVKGAAGHVDGAGHDLSESLLSTNAPAEATARLCHPSRIRLALSSVPGEVAVHLLLALSVLQLVVVSSAASAHPWVQEGSAAFLAWSGLGYLLLSVFALEACLRVLASGLRVHLRDGFNRVDAVALVTSAAALVFAATLDPAFSLRTVRGALPLLPVSLRALRVLRLLEAFRTLRGVIVSIRKLVAPAGRLVVVLLALVYAFASVATWMFSGSVTCANPRLHDTLWHPHCAQLGFSTVAASMFTLFEAAVAGRWVEILDACSTGVGAIPTGLFFFAYRLLVVLLFMPTLAGFIIEGFLAQLQYYEGKPLRFVRSQRGHRLLTRTGERFSIARRQSMNVLYERMFSQDLGSLYKEARDGGGGRHYPPQSSLVDESPPPDTDRSTHAVAPMGWPRRAAAALRRALHRCRSCGKSSRNASGGSNRGSGMSHIWPRSRSGDSFSRVGSGRLDQPSPGGSIDSALAADDATTVAPPALRFHSAYAAQASGLSGDHEVPLHPITPLQDVAAYVPLAAATPSKSLLQSPARRDSGGKRKRVTFAEHPEHSLAARGAPEVAAQPSSRPVEKEEAGADRAGAEGTGDAGTGQEEEGGEEEEEQQQQQQPPQQQQAEKEEKEEEDVKESSDDGEPSVHRSLSESLLRAVGPSRHELRHRRRELAEELERVEVRPRCTPTLPPGARSRSPPLCLSCSASCVCWRAAGAGPGVRNSRGYTQTRHCPVPAGGRRVCPQVARTGTWYWSRAVARS